MTLQRPDIKSFNIKVNQQSVKKNHIHLHHDNYISIESYLFRITGVIVGRKSINGEMIDTEISQEGNPLWFELPIE